MGCVEQLHGNVWNRLIVVVVRDCAVYACRACSAGLIEDFIPNELLPDCRGVPEEALPIFTQTDDFAIQTIGGIEFLAGGDGGGFAGIEKLCVE